MVKDVHTPNHECPDVLQLDQLECSYQKHGGIVYDQIIDLFDLDRIQ
jgi:hypothetical protein